MSMNLDWLSVKKFDPELYQAVNREYERQKHSIELIASENYASARVLALQGSILTNKYAEGYPRHRYYGGCREVDGIEQLAIDRAKNLFNARFANVQPHSGSQANLAVYLALVNPGDKILGMNLNAGGHLTHGSSVNFSGKFFQCLSYGLGANGEIDYNEIRTIALAERPKLIIGGFSAYSRNVCWKTMREIADQVDAKLLVDMAHIAGPVAAKLLPSPLNYAHVVTCTTHKTLAGPRGGLILSNEDDPDLHKKINSAIFPGSQGGPLMHVIGAKAIAFLEASQPEFVTYQKNILANASKMAAVLATFPKLSIISGGTSNHMFLVDLSQTKYTGKSAESLLESIEIVVNKNSIPNDRRSPFLTSGIRIGTPAITRRGMGLKESEILASIIGQLLIEGDELRRQVMMNESRAVVLDLCERFPIYS